MTIQAKLQEALARAIESQGVISTIQAALVAGENDTYETRVVCLPGSCTERQTLRGVYNVSGSVVVLTSIDIENAIATHLQLCNSIRALIGDTDSFPSVIMTQDSSIHIYNRSWHCDGMEDDAGSRGFKATFSWRAVARDTTNNP